MREVSEVRCGHCSICEELLEDPQQCPQKHVFCDLCIQTHLAEFETCPVDMAKLKIEDMKPVLINEPPTSNIPQESSQKASGESSKQPLGQTPDQRQFFQMLVSGQKRQDIATKKVAHKKFAQKKVVLSKEKGSLLLLGKQNAKLKKLQAEDCTIERLQADQRDLETEMEKTRSSVTLLQHENAQLTIELSFAQKEKLELEKRVKEFDKQKEEFEKQQKEQEKEVLMEKKDLKRKYEEMSKKELCKAGPSKPQTAKRSIPYEKDEYVLESQLLAATLEINHLRKLIKSWNKESRRQSKELSDDLSKKEIPQSVMAKIIDSFDKLRERQDAHRKANAL